MRQCQPYHFICEEPGECIAGDARTGLDVRATSREIHWDGIRQHAAAELHSKNHICGQNSPGPPSDPLPQALGSYLQNHGLWMDASWQGHCEMVQPESGGDPRREEEERELTCRVFHKGTTVSFSRHPGTTTCLLSPQAPSFLWVHGCQQPRGKPLL